MLTFLLQSNQYMSICIYVRGAETLSYCLKELQWELPPKTEIKQLLRPDWGAVAKWTLKNCWGNNFQNPQLYSDSILLKFVQPRQGVDYGARVFITDHVWKWAAMVWPWCVTMVFYKLLTMVYCQPWLLSKLLFFIKPVKAHKIFMCLLLYLLW